MRAVWKFTLQINDGDQVLQMPSVSSTRHVELQNGQLSLWIEVDINSATVGHLFRVFATGQFIPEGYYYVGTIQMAPCVWHIYEK